MNPVHTTFRENLKQIVYLLNEIDDFWLHRLHVKPHQNDFKAAEIVFFKGESSWAWSTQLS